MLFPDLPLPQQEQVICSMTAAIKYNVPVNLMLAIAEKENGKPGQWVKNRNGSADVGPMQFNTYYLYDLRKYGILPADVAQKGCYSFDLAAWRISYQLRHDRGDIWTRAANYHSRTPTYNAVYRDDLIRKAAKWENWLEARFRTYAVDPANPQTVFVPKAPAPIRLKPVSLNTVNTSEPIYNQAAARALAAVFAPQTLTSTVGEKPNYARQTF